MHYLIISFTHKNSNISVREQLAFDTPAKNESFLKMLTENKFIQEAIILSTCNRVEFILCAKDTEKATLYLFERLSILVNIATNELESLADVYINQAAIHHLFCVSSSLDSLVVGEAQITGQLKNSFKFSYDKGYCQQHLARALHFAFRCAAAVRNSTEISKNPVSVASVATLKAKEIVKDLNDEEVVVIGLGEMSRLTIKHLLSYGAKVILLNRDKTKVEEFVAEMNSQKITSLGLGDIAKTINRHRILFSATGAPHAIITQDLVKPTDFERYWFDLAVPRDIELSYPQNIQLFSVDDLQDIVHKNLSLREEQAKMAYGIVGKFTQDFFLWLSSLHIEPIIKSLREQAKNAATQEIERAIKKGFLPKNYERNLYKTLDNAFNRFLHTPTIKLKENADKPQIDTIIESLKFLFDIHSEYLTLDQYRCEYNSTEN
ncbi:glutamyl-tRNA reductase [Helicobacter monodelphidis]|uniref:glutamyl-tRNA reductase n=1 Tax=Helicobacter sp. 15-1451 TaxID=2004995 RepID=UPI000DCC706A|nr:glutamyl-tRNA reductase [Helicobacter sp. 15-1451]RAX57924.1 glutamyl-tRNA reductase [Helicobacter sp. 15-1451]